ncbi:hypothetical protein AGABI2DRAFT_177595 [Agaricus bisporus var. bisporus H97]|uniref:hypothetical protein n=1 Tax=Agaricus bisporus var. bisporus (strain H97 / ATCC MYA-4626 / FGSC 10389) TaxID=936046 RepID=UPI00029F52B6|nr:hypothetical protein AGABI2DRAFT_177595 [Agaricus bisporus var. bisporus H97]EKV47929.1 hypothetical protein AGABI2DRAFT_177595 [Agaricus bisporus var. bisporus H97]
MTDDLLQRELYCGAITMIRSEFSPSSKAFGNMSSFRALTTLITSLDSEIANFADFYKLQCSVFDKFRSELTRLGELKQVPLRTLDYAAICGPIELRFTSPIETNIKLSDPWNLACTEYIVTHCGEAGQLVLKRFPIWIAVNGKQLTRNVLQMMSGFCAITARDTLPII